MTRYIQRTHVNKALRTHIAKSNNVSIQANNVNVIWMHAAGLRYDVEKNKGHTL